MCRHFATAVFLLLWMSWPARSQQAAPPEVVSYPELIFHSGKILTADDSFTIAQAVAVRDGKVLAVGETAQMLRLAGPQTQVVDLQGKTVTPGFIDTHFHLHNYTFNPYVNGGTDTYPVVMLSDLSDGETKDSLLRTLRSKGRQIVPRDGWIVFTDSRGEGHSVLERKLFPQLTREDLDEAFPGGPAAVGASHGNNYSSYVVNSAGLKTALEKLPPKTQGIVRDAQTGEPTGVLTGQAAQLFGRGILPWPDMQLVMKLMQENIPRYTAQGITMIQTKTPGFVMAALREFWRRGQMPVRWRANIDVGPDTEVAFKYLGNLTDLGDSWFRITGGPGGVPDPFFDATYDRPRPLAGRESSRPDRNAGSLAARLAEMEKQGPTDTFLAAKYGWSVTNVHNNGDLSTDVYLTEIEKGLREKIVDAYGQRFNSDHGLLLTRETPQGNQFERMKKVGLIPSLNAGYLLEPKPVGDNPKEPSPASQVELLSMQWGKERVFKMLPAKSLIAAGFKPTSESDRWYYPASYPLWLLEKLITRKDDKFGVVWGSEERVNRREALWMKTNWAARYTGDERELGTLEPGKLADLVVLDKDYMSVPEDDISEIRVVMTVIGGKVVFDASRDQRVLPMIPSDMPGH